MLQRQRFNQILGANVRKAREAKGFSQEELADRCGFYRTYINLVETAKRLPSSYSLYRLAKGLDVSINDLFPKSE